MNKLLNHLEEWLIAFLIGAATLVIFFAVAHRFLSGVPVIQDYTIQLNVSWAQELCIFMFVWMAKFGAAYGVRTGIHVGVDVVVNQLNEHNRRRIVLFGLFAGALFTSLVAILGARMVWGNGLHYVFNQWTGSTVFVPEGPTTPDLEWPTWAVYLVIPLGSSLMCFRFLQVAWIFARTGVLPKHNHAHVEGIDEVAPAGAGQGAAK